MAWFRRRTPAPVTPEERALSLPNGMFAPSGNVFGGSTAGVSVTAQSSLRSAAAWSCQRVLISTVSMLPVDAFRPVNGRLVAQTQPAIVARPSGRVSRRGWVAQCIRSGMQAGNIYGRVVATDARGNASQVETIHPDDVTWLPVDGALVPHVNGAPQALWPLGDFWHVPISQFLTPGSQVAMSPTEFAATSIGTGIAAEDFGARFFSDTGHPTMVAKANTDLTEAQAQAIKQSLMNAVRGNREPPVIGADISLEPWQSSPKDSEFIDLLRFEVEQACRWWGVPPSMVYAAVSGQNVTYANVSQADLQFLKYSVQAWVTDLEDAWSDLADITVRFNTDAVLRMDAISRAQLHQVRLTTKTRTINEVRKLEDEEPFRDPIYDEPGIPGSNVPAQAAPMTS